MKVSKQVLTLMVALAAGSAAAAGTPSGTSITNTANASYTDPANPAATLNTPSNTVTTTVLPKAGFDVVYLNNTPADGTTPTSTAAALTPAYDKIDVLPGAVIDTPYTILNNGNVAGQQVTLAADTSGSTSAPVVAYYLDVDNSGTFSAGDTLITGPVSVPVDDPATPADEGKVQVIQRLTVPAGAVAGDKYIASPRGTGPVFDSATSTNPAVQEAATDLQYTRATVATPALVLIAPTVIPGGAAPAAPVPGPTTPPTGAPAGNTYLPPTTGTPNPGTVTVVNATTGNQDAYPKSDTNATPDVVTFVGNVKNNGTIADTVKIKPDLTNLPTGATVVVRDIAGNVLTPDAGGLYTLPGGPVAPTGTVEFQLVVTYPDSDLVPATPAADIVIPVGVFSGNVPSATPLATGTFTIHPPKILFGDTAAGNPDATQAPAQTVIPNGTFNTTTGTANDASAVFPMSVKNNGTYTEPFTLAGTVPIKLLDGTTVNVPVKYYTTAGVLVPGGVTPGIAPGATLDLIAVVDVPNNAAITTGAAGTNPAPVLSQTATGNFSGATASDINDIINVGAIGAITVDKYVGVNAAPTIDAAGKVAKSALPGATVNYAIVAKNTYNGPVKSFILKDSNAAGTTNVYTFSDYQTASVNLTGFAAGAAVYYSIDNGANWTLAAPAAVVAPATIPGIWVYIETDGVTPGAGPSAGDVIPANASVQLNIGTKVK
ncbi:hypothetical protein [Deinococcus sp.]|uniref:hypothetical protein n=1 Tax=Deinococcus sp. TaxID=47478 RepID=UPI0025D40B69|nr:hypothetical protein [Deinococcus sp.]